MKKELHTLVALSFLRAVDIISLLEALDDNVINLLRTLVVLSLLRTLILNGGIMIDLNFSLMDENAPRTTTTLLFAVAGNNRDSIRVNGSYGWKSEALERSWRQSC